MMEGWHDVGGGLQVEPPRPCASCRGDEAEIQTQIVQSFATRMVGEGNSLDSCAV